MINVFITFICALVAPIFLAIASYQGMTTAEEFPSILCWLIHGLQRVPLLLKSFLHIFFAFYITDFQYSNMTGQLNFALEASDRLKYIQEIFQSGEGFMKPIYGVLPEFDEASIVQPCHVESIEVTGHNQYRCLGLDQSFLYGIKLVERIVSHANHSPFPGGYFMNNEDIYHLYHLMNCHIFSRSDNAKSYLEIMAEREISSFIRNLYIYLGINIAISILSLIWYIYLAKQYDFAYSTAMTLLRRLPPKAIFSNNKLEQFIKSKDSESESHEMSLGEKIIHTSSNPILLLSRNQIIENVNLSITQIFGFSPDQLIGQSFTSVIADECKEDMTDQLSLLKAGQASDQYQGNVTCVTNANDQIPCTLR